MRGSTGVSRVDHVAGIGRVVRIDRAGVDEALDAVRQRGLGEHARRLDVVARRSRPSAARWPWRGGRRRRCRAAPVERRRIVVAALHDLDRQPVERDARGDEAARHDAHADAALDERLDEALADEAGAADDQHARRRERRDLAGCGSASAATPDRRRRPATMRSHRRITSAPKRPCRRGSSAFGEGAVERRDAARDALLERARCTASSSKVARQMTAEIAPALGGDLPRRRPRRVQRIEHRAVAARVFAPVEVALEVQCAPPPPSRADERCGQAARAPPTGSG